MVLVRDKGNISHSPGRSWLSSHEKVDVCRGLFAFLVVLAHGLDLSWAIHPEVPHRLPTWLHDFLLYVPAAGVYWVIGFFVISGYCIQLSVERQVEDNSFSLAYYLIARLSRILPLYYTALLLTVVVEWLVGPDRPPCWPQGLNLPTLLAQLFIVQNLTQTYGSFAPSWSITNEMFYYMFFGVIVCLALRRRMHATLVGMSICLVLTLLFDWLYFCAYRHAYVRTPGLLFGLGIIWFQGALVAQYRTSVRDSQSAWLLSNTWPLVLILAVIMWWSQRVHLQVVYLVLGAAFTLMLVQFVASEDFKRDDTVQRVPRALILTLGLASYPTYLFHGPILVALGAIIIRWQLVSDWRITWLILTTVGITTGVFLGYLAERPIMSWRARYLRQWKQFWLVSARDDAPLRALGMQR
jgi:peptidoglycan/LPS O-acetylase OafA/YrhL